MKHMRRIGLLGLLAVALCALGAAAQGWVFERYTSVFEGVDYKYPEIAMASPGQPYTVEDRLNDWLKVSYTDMNSGAQVTGWVWDEGGLLPSKAAQDASAVPVAPDMEGFVLCERLTLRDAPQVTANAVGELEYASTFEILQAGGGWYQVRYVGMERTVVGWVRGEFVLENPRRITLNQETPVYCYPREGALRVGLLDAGSTAVVIMEAEGWYVISLRGASGFVKM